MNRIPSAKELRPLERVPSGLPGLSMADELRAKLYKLRYVLVSRGFSEQEARRLCWAHWAVETGHLGSGDR